MKFKKVLKIDQVKFGAILSYFLIVLNTFQGIFLAPFILTHIGDSSYGVYKTIGSLSSSLLILDLGIGSTLTRYIAKYRADLETKKIGPFVSMMLCECIIILPIIILVEIFLYSQLEQVYSISFSREELILAKQIFIVLSINVLLNIVEHFLNGIISGYNDFVFVKAIKILSLLLRVIFIIILIPITKNAIFLVKINVSFTLIFVFIQLLYIVKQYHIHIDFNTNSWERGIFKESFFYTMLIFLTTIVTQVNNNLDNVIVGVFCGTQKVAVYSFGLMIFGIFEQLSTAISGVALPTVSQIIVQENGNKRIQDFIVKLGRIQFMLLGAAAIGFIVLGEQFIKLWLGKGYEDVYWIVLILIIPAMFELCVNVCLSVLRAKNMIGFRTMVLCLSTILNFAVSVVGIKYLGYYSAAIGTATSFFIGSLIVMNIYYVKKLKFNMIQIYKRIMYRTFPCLLIAGGVTTITSFFIKGTWFAFILNGIIFILIYLRLLLKWGFSSEEKKNVSDLIVKMRKRG